MTSSPQPRILVVEDNGALRRLIARVLSESGFTILEASSAPEGLNTFRAQPQSIDLAIIDMVMPGMSGLDLAAELDRQRPGMKILYTSGHVSSVAMESISQRSPAHVLLKPFDPGDLIDRVVHLLEPEVPNGKPGVGTISRMKTQSVNAWDRLIEASDVLAPGAVAVLEYSDTGAAFSIAAAHSAALRAAGLNYAFRASKGGDRPFGLFVAPAHAVQARELIERIGLGADVAQPV